MIELPIPGELAGSQSLLHRFSHRDGKILAEFGGFLGGTGICQSMAQAAANVQLAAAARRKLALGVIIDPQTTTNTILPSRRAPSFRNGGYSFPQAWNPERDSLSAEVVEWYSRAVVDAQRLRHATVILSPYHVGTPGLTRERETDLELAVEGSRYFYGHGLGAPPADEPHAVGREYWVAIRLIRPFFPDDVDAMAALYAPLRCSGYWIAVDMPFPLSAAEVEAIATLAHTLKAKTMRSVGVAGVGPLAIAFAASRLDCALAARIGPAEQRDPRPFLGSVVHPHYLRNFSVVSEYGKAAFRAHPCACGHHEADVPPRGNGRVRHALSIGTQEYLALKGGALELQASRIAQRVAQANEAAASLGAPLLDSRAWMAPLDIAIRLQGAEGTGSAD